jgi:uncharacterized protein affecting Mg2+/Co2+ transport
MNDKIANNKNTNYSLTNLNLLNTEKSRTVTRRNLITGVRDKHRNVVTYGLMGFQPIVLDGKAKQSAKNVYDIALTQKTTFTETKMT